MDGGHSRGAKAELHGSAIIAAIKDSGVEFVLVGSRHRDQRGPAAPDRAAIPSCAWSASARRTNASASRPA